MIRLLIVDDSRVIREVIKDLVEGSDIEVVGEAANGQEAIDLTGEIKPDIITMDIMMPVMDGLTAVEHIMAYTPTPILVLASSINRKDVNIAFEAIQLGALDVMEKPENLTREGFAQLRDSLLQKLRLLCNIKVIKHLRGRKKRPRVIPEIPAPARKRPKSGILAIGASTGGPKAVMNILQALPENFPIGGVLVQHIGTSFTSGFVEWLDKECSLNVKLAQHGDTIEPGKILVGPGDKHIEVDGANVNLNDNPPVNNCRPSVDVLFQSVADTYGKKALAVLLTGMGRDGADGISRIKERNGYTIVQDEGSSVIFGMPRAAIELGGADMVLPLGDITAQILRIVGIGGDH